MQRDKVFSIITIACFCSIILIPIGLALMWFQNAWKKKRKIIITGAGSLLYIAIVAFILLLEPSYNTGGVSLPFKYKGGETAYDAPANPGRPSKKEKKISPASDKKSKSDSKKSDADEIKYGNSIKLVEWTRCSGALPESNFWGMFMWQSGGTWYHSAYGNIQ